MYSVTKSTPDELAGGTSGTAFHVQIFCDRWNEQTAGYNPAAMPGLTWRLLQGIELLKAQAKSAQGSYGEFAASLDRDFKYQRNRKRHQTGGHNKTTGGDLDGSNSDDIELNSDALWAAVKSLQKGQKRGGDDLHNPPKKPGTGNLALRQLRDAIKDKNWSITSVERHKTAMKLLASRCATCLKAGRDPSQPCCGQNSPAHSSLIAKVKAAKSVSDL